MAEIAEKKKNASPLPFIIAGVVILVLVIAFLRGRKSKTPKSIAKRPAAAAAAAKDPCEGIPEWACATAALLDPIAKTSVDVFKAQAQSDVEAARLRARA